MHDPRPLPPPKPSFDIAETMLGMSVAFFFASLLSAANCSHAGAWAFGLCVLTGIVGIWCHALDLHYERNHREP